MRCRCRKNLPRMQSRRFAMVSQRVPVSRLRSLKKVHEKRDFLPINQRRLVQVGMGPRTCTSKISGRTERPYTGPTGYSFLQAVPGSLVFCSVSQLNRQKRKGDGNENRQ